MEIIEVQASEYQKHISDPLVIFNSVGFSELNKDKVDELHYLLFKDSKIRLGIILGVKNKAINSPFSAPFGGFSFLQSDVKASVIIGAVEVLEKWLVDNKYKNIQLSLPPNWFAPDFYTRLVNTLFSRGFKLDQMDVNHQFVVPADFDRDYSGMLHKNARKNLNNGLANGLTWTVLETAEAIRAYEVIAINRSAKNKPLRMSFEQVMKTAKVIPSQFFLVEQGAVAIASAIVFQINPKVVQVIYWGDVPEYSELRGMNFLTHQVFQYYARQSIQVIDIGISTEYSVPNFGLCEFKESIGCSVSLKYSFSKSF